MKNNVFNIFPKGETWPRMTISINILRALFQRLHSKAKCHRPFEFLQVFALYGHKSHFWSSALDHIVIVMFSF